MEVGGLKTISHLQPRPNVLEHDSLGSGSARCRCEKPGLDGRTFYMDQQKNVQPSAALRNSDSALWDASKIVLPLLINL